MKKTPRTDKRRNIGKVAEVIAKNPNKTVRELANETGLGKSTTARAVEELGQTGTKDETITYIVGSSKENLKDFAKVSRAVMKKIVRDHITEDGELVDGKTISISQLVEMNKIAIDDMKRVTVFGGDLTNAHGGLNVVSESDFLE